MKIRPVAAELFHADRQTDMTKLKVAFSSFANAPKKYKFFENFEKHKHKHNPKLFHQPTLMHNFLYSLTISLLHYYPRHVSSINMPIFRRTNCIITVSGIFALCKRLHSTLVDSGLLKMSMLMLETCRG